MHAAMMTEEKRRKKKKYDIRIGETEAAQKGKGQCSRYMKKRAKVTKKQCRSMEIYKQEKRKERMNSE